MILINYLKCQRLKAMLLTLVFFVCISYAFSQDTVYREFYYPDGKLSSRGLFVKGQPDGYWEGFYPDGSLKSAGWRRAGVLDSIWHFYDPSGYKESEISYLHGLKNGYYSIFRTEDIDDSVVNYLYSKELYINDSKEGTSYYYRLPGYLAETAQFVHNKRNGSTFYFDSLGLIVSYSVYRDGIMLSHQIVNKRDSSGNKVGVWKEFYSNVEIKSEQLYQSGRITGYSKEFDRRGQLISAKLFHNDSLIADSLTKLSFTEPTEFLEVYANGQPRHRGSFHDSLPIGVHRFYDSTGAVISSVSYSSEGIKIAEGIFTDEGFEQGPWKYFFPDGTVSKSGNYRKGKQLGIWKFYYPTGSLLQEGSYVNGKYSGIWKFYNTSAQLLREIEYLNGKENGQCSEYDDSARVVASGMYIDGQREGLWKFITGDQIQTGPYRMGDKHGVWKYYYISSNRLRFSGEFKLGQPDGKHLYFYDNGGKEHEEFWRSGKRIKVWKYYRYHGSLELMVFYKQGKEAQIEHIADDM